MGRIIPSTAWAGRSEVTTTYTDRVIPGENCMSIIETGFWNDTKLWEDNKLWWDVGSVGTSWAGRTNITTNWS